MKFSLIPASALKIPKLDAFLAFLYLGSVRYSLQENIEIVPLEQFLLK